MSGKIDYRLRKLDLFACFLGHKQKIILGSSIYCYFTSLIPHKQPSLTLLQHIIKLNDYASTSASRNALTSS